MTRDGGAIEGLPELPGFVEWFRFGETERVEAAVAMLERIGCRRLRTHVSWADWHRPEGPDWYAWLLPLLAGRFELLPALHYTPPSLSETGAANGPPREPKAFADFLDLLIDRHGALFDTVELWNEPNNLLDWDWRVDPDWDKFADMVGGAGHWARRRGKRAVLGGPCPTDLKWLDIMGGHGVLAEMDVISVHGFPGTWDSESATWPGWEDLVGDVRRAVHAWNPALAVWITETGYSTWRHDDAGQIRRFLEAAAAPAERVYWYALQDLSPNVPSQEGLRFDARHYHCGVHDHRGRRKLLARALADGGMSGAARILELERRPPSVVGTRPVLVTGGAGFVGANLADRLAADGEHVLVLDNLSRPGVEENLARLEARHPHRIAARVADLRDADAVREAAADAGSVFHLAAQVAVTDSLIDPRADFDVNLGGTLNLLDALRARAEPVPLVFASTNKVYGDLADVALALGPDGYCPVDAALAGHGVPETRPLAFHTPYGCSKGAADQYVLDHAASFGIPTAVLRMSCVYGPLQKGTEDQGWLAHFVRSALAGDPIAIFGDGEQVRDVLHVDDAVDAYRAARERIASVSGRAFNLGGGPANAVSLNRAIAAIGELAGRPVACRFDAWRPGDQRWFVSDIRAAQEALGLARPRDWRSGLADLVAWFGEDEHAALPSTAPKRANAKEAR